jgi:hypothetical protein
MEVETVNTQLAKRLAELEQLNLQSRVAGIEERIAELTMKVNASLDATNKMKAAAKKFGFVI